MQTSGIICDITRSLQSMAFEILKFKPGQDLPSIEAEYRDKVSRIMTEYMESDRPVTAFRNEMRRAMNDAFNTAIVAGWADGGGSGELPSKLRDYVNEQIDAEIANIDTLFQRLRELRQTPDRTDETNYIDQRADGYTHAIVGIYAYGKGVAGQDRPGKWVYGDTIEHCTTCQDLQDSVHPLSWYIENDYIPQQRGSATLECGGWQCQCSVVDPETGEQLMP